MRLEDKIILARHVDMQSNLIEFEGESARQLFLLYSAAKARIVRRLKGLKKGSIHTRKQQLQLLAEVEKTLQELVKIMAARVAEHAVTAHKFAAAEVGNILSWDGAVKGFNLAALSTPQIIAIVAAQKFGDKQLDGWLMSMFGEGLDRVKAEIATGKVRGLSYKNLVKSIIDMLGGSEIRRHLDAIVRSYVQKMAALAARMVVEANKEVVNELEWSAVMEGASFDTGRGTCIRCAALDGSRYKNYGAAPAIPLHLRCRCMLLPVTKSWLDLGINADDMTEKTSKWYNRDYPSRKILDYGYTDKNYGEWWASMPASFRRNAIGPRRTELIDKGVLSFDDLVDHKTGRLFTIDELEAKHGKVQG